MRTLLRAPLLHYLLIGAAAFCLATGTRERHEPAGEVIVIGAARREAIRQRTGLAREAGGDAAERAEIERIVEEEILYREAVARGLGNDSEVVRERVVESMRVVADDADAGDDELLAQGLALGLDRSDLVARRHLAATMRLLVTAPARAEAVTDADLRELLERERERFAAAPSTSLVHVYFRGDAHAAAAQADRVRDQLDAGGIAPQRAATLGDPFPLGSRLRGRSDAQLDGTFGRGFARSVAALPVGSWSEPIRSAYGVHLVLVEERIPAHVPPLSQVRRALVERLYHERAQRRLQAWLAEKRNGYRVIVEETPPAAHIASASPVLPRPAILVGD